MIHVQGLNHLTSDMINKGNESDVANIVFEILAIGKSSYFLFHIVFSLDELLITH